MSSIIEQVSTGHPRTRPPSHNRYQPHRLACGKAKTARHSPLPQPPQRAKKTSSAEPPRDVSKINASHRVIWRPSIDVPHNDLRHITARSILLAF